MPGSSTHSHAPTAALLVRDVPELDPRLAAVLAKALPRGYAEAFDAAERAGHIRVILDLTPDDPVHVFVQPLRKSRHFRITFIALDCPGEFSWITGFLAAAGANIVQGDVTTLPRTAPSQSDGKRLFRRRRLVRRKTTPSIDTTRAILDVFHVTGDLLPPPGELAARLEEDMKACFRLKREEGPEACLRFVNTRVAEHLLSQRPPPPEVLLPLRIHIRNDPRRRATCVTVHGQDTPAFLYCLSNALAASAFYIEAVRIRTVRGEVADTFWVTDRRGRLVSSREARNRLRLAILVTKQFSHFLGWAANPFQALTRFNRLLGDTGIEARTVRRLIENPAVLQDLANVLGAGSAFWESFLRLQYENLLPMLDESGRNRELTVRSPAWWIERFREALHSVPSEATDQAVSVINRVKDEALARIELEFILDPRQDLDRLGLALTALAEALIEVLLQQAMTDLVARYGQPANIAGKPCAFTVMGLGKLGGRELGFASDLELLFVFSEEGRTSGPESIRASEFFARLATAIRDGIRARPDGIFHVDLRLRPYGSDGPPACSLETFCRYYGPGGDAHDFERQALVKMRRIAGDSTLGTRIEAFRDEILYQSHLVDRHQIETLRQRQRKELTRPGRINAKYSPGGLVDIEYTVQYLQIRHGHQDPALRTTSTRDAILALAARGILAPVDEEGLLAAHTFLRRLINSLRMLRGHAHDLELPEEDSIEFLHLARRMGYRTRNGLSAEEQLRRDVAARMAFVRDLCRRYLGSPVQVTRDTGTLADLALNEHMPPELTAAILRRTGFRRIEAAVRNLRNLAGYTGDRDVFCQLIVLAEPVLRDSPDCDMALNNWERFARNVISPRGFHQSLLREPVQMELFLRIAASSQFLADTLIRHPENFGWLLSPEQLLCPKSREELFREVRNETTGLHKTELRLDALRRGRARHMLRIGTRDICLQVPFLETVHELSWLADACIDAVFHIEAERFPEARQLLDTGRICVLALGKLGGRELNYSSDVDLLFFLREPRAGKHDEAAHDAVRRLCRSVIHSLTEATPAGRLYRVDMRLRPYGRSGSLVPTETGLLAYFEKAAHPIEFQAMLKASPVIGGERLGPLLHRLLLAGRQRFSPAEFADAAEAVRRRGAAHAERVTRTEYGKIDIKTGTGGIRDIEFGVQLLQLQALPHTPDVLAPGTLDALDALHRADILTGEQTEAAREAYVLLRRIEHLLQIMHDRQVHALDMSPANLEALARRLRPDAPDPRALEADVRAALRFSRDFFEHACARCRTE